MLNTVKAISAKKQHSIAVFIILFLAALSCAPRSTYPQNKVIDSIVSLCRKEYKINVQAKIVGKTVGVYIPLENLFDRNLKLAPAVAEKVDNVILSTCRVVLSSDAKLDFCLVVAADTKMLGTELVMLRYIPDIRKYFYMHISRGEYFKRMAWSVKFNPQVIARKTVRELFTAMQTSNVDKVIADFFMKKPKVSLGAMDFFRTLNELNMKNNAEYKILELKSRRLSQNNTLVYCRTWEDYAPKAAFQNYDFLYPPQFNNEYLAIVSIRGVAATIEQIVSLYRRNGDNFIREIPPHLLAMRDVQNWPDTDFSISDTSLGEFLADQIAVRLKEVLADNFEVKQSLGHYDQYRKAFKFFLGVKARAKDVAFSREGIERLKDFISDLLYGYDFREYGQVYISDLFSGDEFIIDRQGLEEYKHQHMGIKKYFLKKKRDKP